MDERSMTRLRQLPDDELGRVLASAAEASFPQAPDIASVVQARLEREALAYPELRPRRALTAGGWFPWLRVRRATALAILAIVLLAAIAAAVIFGVPGIRFIFVPSLPTLPPSPSTTVPPAPTVLQASPAFPSPSVSLPPTPVPSPTPLGATLGVGTPVSLDVARASVTFPVQLPSDPAAGPPDQVYLEPIATGYAVSLVWRPRPGLPEANGGIGMLLTEFDGYLNPDQFQKVIGPGTSVTPVRIGDGAGYWLHGAQHFFIGPSATSGNWREQQVRLAGDTLLWNIGGQTYRLEAAVPLSDAIRIAESLAP
jgi:hypothetical protein